MIIVFGSINMDFVARVDHFPAPGETILAPGYDTLAGGKGANQALACARGGAKTALVGMVGDDGMGARMLHSLRSNEVLTSGVGTSDDLPTGMAFIQIDQSGENQITVLSGANAVSSATQVPDEILIAGNILLLQMELNVDEAITLMERAKKRGVTVILNLAPAYHLPQKALSLVDYLIVNETEAQAIAKVVGIGDGQDYMLLAKALAMKGGHACIITMGEKGSVAYTNEGKGWRVPSLPLDKVVDTTGAGDCFCGTFAAALHSKLALGSALRRASVAAGLSCTKNGAQDSYPFYADIEDKLSDFPQAQPVT